MIHYRVARTLDPAEDVLACGSVKRAWRFEKYSTKALELVTCRRCRKSNAYRRAKTLH